MLVYNDQKSCFIIIYNLKSNGLESIIKLFLYVIFEIYAKQYKKSAIDARSGYMGNFKIYSNSSIESYWILGLSVF